VRRFTGMYTLFIMVQKDLQYIADKVHASAVTLANEIENWACTPNQHIRFFDTIVINAQN
jgi:glycine cleavage system pyridoxal-binding protein P